MFHHRIILWELAPLPQPRMCCNARYSPEASWARSQSAADTEESRVALSLFDLTRLILYACCVSKCEIQSIQSTVIIPVPLSMVGSRVNKIGSQRQRTKTKKVRVHGKNHRNHRNLGNIAWSCPRIDFPLNVADQRVKSIACAAPWKSAAHMSQSSTSRRSLNHHISLEKTESIPQIRFRGRMMRKRTLEFQSNRGSRPNRIQILSSCVSKSMTVEPKPLISESWRRLMTPSFFKAFRGRHH